MNHDNKGDFLTPDISKKQNHESLIQSFVTVSGISGMAMIVSLFMNIAIAAIIGASASKDAYDIASYLPRVVLFMFGLDLFRGISTSLFSRLDVNKTEDPAKVFSTLLNGVIIVSFIAIIIAEVFAHPLIKMIGTGLSPQTSLLAVKLTRLLIPTLGLIAVTGLTGSILLAHHYYGLTEALAALPKVTILLGVLGWGKTLDVWAMVIAMIIGLAGQLPVMFYFLRRCGLHYSLTLNIKSPAIKSALIDAVPLGIGTIAIYLSGIFLQRTASFGREGTVACFNYSIMLCGVLTALVCRPASVILAPRVTRSLELQNYQESSSLLAKSLGTIVLACLAGTSFVWMNSFVIVDIILGHGKFTPDAVEHTGSFLRIMFLGVLAAGLMLLGFRVLLAKRKVKTIMSYCLITSIVQTVLAVGGRNFWGVYAAPIAYTAGICLYGILSIISAVYIVRLHEKMKNFTNQ